jgi:hypothetical protein
MLVVVLAQYRSYHLWPWQSGLQDRVHWCGRDFLGPSEPLTRADVDRFEPYPPRRVGTTGPIGARRELYAAETPTGRRAALDPPLPCAMTVYLRTDEDRYARYVLSGGP